MLIFYLRVGGRGNCVAHCASHPAPEAFLLGYERHHRMLGT